VPFITLEGTEGCGKSTQARRLRAVLGPDVLLTKEPGGTRLGASIRQLLLDRAHPAMTAEAELLLYFADRAQHVREVIRPALEAGRVVISDRYVDSSIAYQVYGRGLPREDVEALASFATDGLAPDLTLLLDVPMEVGLARVEARGGRDRLEAEEPTFHARVRDGYAALIAQEPERWIRVDALGDEAQVTQRVVAVLRARGYCEEQRVH
jgi:dTMP kinase